MAERLAGVPLPEYRKDLTVTVELNVAEIAACVGALMGIKGWPELYEPDRVSARDTLFDALMACRQAPGGALLERKS